MEFVKDKKGYSAQIIDLAYKKYTEEMSCHACGMKKTKQGFEQFLNTKMNGINGIVGVDEGKICGFLLYTLREAGEIYCDVPVWGYGADGKDSIKTISRLFQHLAKNLVSDKKVCFSVRLYAHDEEMQKLFSFMQFGIQSEKGIRHVEKTEHTSEYNIRELSKKEVEQKWKEIWGILLRLIAHLQGSPVFYPGDEFTEEVYKAFFADSGTRVFAAMDKESLIGLIEANSEKIWYLSSDLPILNVGEIYVNPEYRGKKIAQDLLYCVDMALKADGVDYEWVEHGTANPTARGFWNKYFETMEYEFVRTIERFR